jgi:hypothetical protein
MIKNYNLDPIIGWLHQLFVDMYNECRNLYSYE